MYSLTPQVGSKSVGLFLWLWPGGLTYLQALHVGGFYFEGVDRKGSAFAMPPSMPLH